MVEINPLANMLTGPAAFYNQPDYKEKTKSELEQPRLPAVSYTWNSESRALRITKLVLSIIIFPVGLYTLIHGLAGKAIVPASLYGQADGFIGKLLPSSLTRMLPEGDVFDKARAAIDLDGDFKYKRITVEVDGYSVDAMIVGKTSTFDNGRWVLHSTGNGDFYEGAVAHNQTFKHIITKLDANAIVFNYPGVGASSGLLPHRDTMAKAYRAMLHLLEDTKQGIGAKEIVGYGHSLGGAVLLDALQSHTLKNDIKYCFVPRQTFSNLSDAAANITESPLVGLLVKIIGWNIDCVAASKRVPAPQVILQTVRERRIVGDGVIAREVALAQGLLEDPECDWSNKRFIGISEWHNSEIQNIDHIATTILSLL